MGLIDDAMIGSVPLALVVHPHLSLFYPPFFLSLRLTPSSSLNQALTLFMSLSFSLSLMCRSPTLFLHLSSVFLISFLSFFSLSLSLLLSLSSSTVLCLSFSLSLTLSLFSLSPSLSISLCSSPFYNHSFNWPSPSICPLCFL